MEDKSIVDILVRLRDEDETKHLETLLVILEHYRTTASPEYKELIEAELNRLAEKIAEVIKREKEI